MKKQVILDFLNLPGIIGLGLMDGHSRPYFSGIDKLLNFQQKEALTQGIQQVIGTTPTGFESFDFRFAQKDAHIYKLGNGVILLVVTHEKLNEQAYQEAIERLKETLESDPHSAVSTFRLLAGSTTLNRPVMEVPNGERPGEQPEYALAGVTPQLFPDHSKEYRWIEGISALNQLTDATAQYLGKIVVANTWRTTRPEGDVLKSLQLDRNGHFSFAATGSADGSNPISAEDLSSVHHWVEKFVQKCALIIRDYPELVLKQSLDDQQRSVLNIIPPQ